MPRYDLKFWVWICSRIPKHAGAQLGSEGMAVRRAPENGVHRAGPGERLAAELDESVEPPVWVGECADLVPAVVLVVLGGILRVGSGQ